MCGRGGAATGLSSSSRAQVITTYQSGCKLLNVGKLKGLWPPCCLSEVSVAAAGVKGDGLAACRTGEAEAATEL